MPGQPITWEDVYNATAITYPAVYRTAMNGAAIKATLEGVADNLFYPDPYLQQGGDMVRVGGMGFTVHVDGVLGERISNMHLLKSGAAIEADKDYVVAGWASINEDTAGTPDLGCRGGACEGPCGSAASVGTDRQVRAGRQLTAVRLAGSAP